MCVIRNRRLMKRPYTWAVHINLNEEVPPGDISPMWKKVARKLEDRGIVALWVREPNRLNKLHYHIIVKNQIGKAELKRAIEEAMRVGSQMTRLRLPVLVQNVPHLLSQRPRRERLLEEGHARLHDAVPDHRIVGVPGHEHHLDPRPRCGQPLGQQPTAHLRHYHVGDEQVDRLVIPLGQPHPSPPWPASSTL